MPSLIRLSEEYREALIIRCRRILVLGLIDYFNANNDFGKLIVKELIDMFEGSVKGLAESLRIPLFKDNGKHKWFSDIVRDIKEAGSCDFIDEIEKINAVLSSRNFNSLKQLRNDETHYLNLPDIPKETVMRVWRLYFQCINLIDTQLVVESKERFELKDFYHLYDFFNKVVLDGNALKIDLNSLKIEKREIEVQMGEEPYIEEFERGILEIIDEIKNGNYSEENELNGPY